jgi:hypothetical protein
MRRILQIIGLVVLLASWYVAGYAIWRGPALMEKCDHPNYVFLSDGPIRIFFAPLIVVDRWINRFTTEIVID